MKRHQLLALALAGLALVATVGAAIWTAAGAGPAAKEWSVDPLEYGRFLCKTFDGWRRRDVGKVFINLSETLVAQHMDNGPAALPVPIHLYSMANSNNGC